MEIIKHKGFKRGYLANLSSPGRLFQRLITKVSTSVSLVDDPDLGKANKTGLLATVSAR